MATKLSVFPRRPRAPPPVKIRLPETIPFHHEQPRPSLRAAVHKPSRRYPSQVLLYYCCRYYYYYYYFCYFFFAFPSGFVQVPLSSTHPHVCAGPVDWKTDHRRHVNIVTARFTTLSARTVPQERPVFHFSIPGANNATNPPARTRSTPSTNCDDDRDDGENENPDYTAAHPLANADQSLPSVVQYRCCRCSCYNNYAHTVYCNCLSVLPFVLCAHTFCF